MNLSLTELRLPAYLRPEKAMTEDELLRFCAANDSVRIEREPNGDLLLMSPSGSETSNINTQLTRFLAEWADAAWVQLSRWQALTRQQKQKFAPLCPDFIVELRSPSDTLPALHRKMQQWIDNGAQLAWLLDPIDRAVSIYRPGQAAEHYQDPTSIQGTGPVAAFELVLSKLWGN